MTNFTVSIFRIKIKGGEKIPLPSFPGVTLRGAFGMALKRVTCVTREKNCEACMLNQKCVYAASFENIFSGDSPYLKGTDRAPHPVLIYPVELGKQITRKGATYTLGLTVFGNKRDYLPYYIYAIVRLGKIGLGKQRGKFRVVSVMEKQYPRGQREIFDPRTETLSFEGKGISVRSLLDAQTRRKKITLQTLTPLRLRVERKLQREPQLNHILKSAAFRLRLLSSLYSDEPLDLFARFDFSSIQNGIEVVESNFEWWEISRYSRRQGRGMNLGGAIGRMVLQGDLREIYPLLNVGQLLHVGKNTGFGLGRYELKTNTKKEVS